LDSHEGKKSKKNNTRTIAREINESEYSIKLIEEGIIPENNEGIIKKIEDYLGIRIRKTFNVSDVKKESFSSEHVVFNEDSTKKEAKERF
jgi:ribosome-binding protein aMBF1 (putative translation factor)